eukprot:TRINITY_DN51294_c0_g1_i3.p1 TRINITY_DN51294_c0_g1~~TRINITY_DN51294_c0_g1_i3.p1  ORF type:complete len:1277 (-),score=138.69 TRINITY_DN51294_c0_g1_i3:539-4315(-)
MADVTAKMGAKQHAGISYDDHYHGWASIKRQDMPMRTITVKAQDGDLRYPPLQVPQDDDYIIMMPCQHLDTDTLVAPLIRAEEIVQVADDAAPVAMAFGTYNVQSLRRAGRSAQLQRQMKAAKLDVVCLQETRTQGPSSRTSAEGYHICTSGCSSGASHGCETWVSCTIGGLQVRKEEIQILSHDPRWLAIKLSCKAVTVIVINVHAPHSGHRDSDVFEFWLNITQLITETNRHNNFIMVLGDYNKLPTGGDIQTGDEETHVDRFLRAHSLTIPYLWRCYNKDGHIKNTCFSNFGQSAIDHIAIGQSFLNNASDIEVFVDDATDIMLKRLDHVGVICRLKVQRKDHRQHRHRHLLPFDLKEALDNKHRMAHIISTIPDIHWSVSVDSHWHIIQQHELSMLQQDFPVMQKRKTSSWMSKMTVEVIDVKAKLFKQIVYQQRLESPDQIWLGYAREYMRILSKIGRKAAIDDRRKAFDEIASLSADAFSDNNARDAYRQMKRLLPFKARMHYPMKDKNGVIMTDIKEVDGAWLAHWKDLLQGEDTSFDQLFESAKHRPPAEWSDAFSFDKVPVVNDVSRAIAGQKTGRMHGNDLIPAEFWRSNIPEAAEHLHPLVVKIWLTGQRPTQWQGDTHATVPKKAGGHRGIALSDVIAKTVNKIVRKMFITDVEAQSVDTAFGAFARRGTDFAVHTRTLAAQLTAHMHLSTSMIFIDIISAFDMVRREDIVGALNSDDPVHQQIAAIHQHSWTVTPFSNAPLLVNRGVKQGDPVADATFMLIISKCIRTIRTEALRIGCELKVPHTAGNILSEDTHEDTMITTLAGHCDLTDISYIDDMNIIVTDRNPMEMIRKTHHMCCYAKNVLASAGFDINDKKNKTEVTLILRGAGKAAATEEMTKRGWAFDIGSHKIRVVDEYRHIGIPHSFNNDAARTCAMAVCKLRQRTRESQKHILQSRVYTSEHKRKAVNICVASACYASATWSPWSNNMIAKFGAAYMKMIRLAEGKTYNPHVGKSFTDEQVLLSGRHVRARDILRLRRLQYLPRLLREAPDVLKALVQALAGVEGSWTKAAVQDLHWAWTNMDQLEELGNPMASTTLWEAFLTEWPQAWKALLRKLREKAENGEALYSDDILTCSHAGSYDCTQCCTTFLTPQGLSLHMIKAHGHVAAGSFYARDHICSWCLRDCRSRPLLVQHLRVGHRRHGTASCLHQMILHGVEPMTQEEMERALEEDRALARHNRAKGLHVARPRTPYAGGRASGPLLRML